MYCSNVRTTETYCDPAAGVPCAFLVPYAQCSQGRIQLVMPRQSIQTLRLNTRTRPISSCAPRPALQFHSPGKQHVVLEVHVAMKVPLEGRQLREAYAIRRASVRGRDVPPGEHTNDPQRVSGVAMLPLHHADGVFNRAERVLRGPAPARRRE